MSQHCHQCLPSSLKTHILFLHVNRTRLRLLTVRIDKPMPQAQQEVLCTKSSPAPFRRLLPLSSLQRIKQKEAAGTQGLETALQPPDDLLDIHKWQNDSTFRFYFSCNNEFWIIDHGVINYSGRHAVSKESCSESANGIIGAGGSRPTITSHCSGLASKCLSVWAFQPGAVLRPFCIWIK